MRSSIRASGTSAETGTPGTPEPPQVEVDVLVEGGAVLSSGSPWVLLARTFAQNRLAILGVGVVLAIALFSFVGPLIYHTDQLNPNLTDVNLAPGGTHPLGTDSNGNDVLARLMTISSTTQIVSPFFCATMEHIGSTLKSSAHNSGNRTSV